MTVGLSIFEIPYPNTIFKESLTRSLSFIIFESTLIFQPASFMKSYKCFIYLGLPFGYLFESVLCSKTIKHSILELTFVSDNVPRIKKFSIAMHFIIFPLTLIRLSIRKYVYSLSFFERFLPKLISNHTVSKIFGSKLPSRRHVRVSIIGNDVMSRLEVLHLIFYKRIEGVVVVIIFCLCTNFGINHSIEIIFMSGLFRLLLKQRLVSGKIPILCDFIRYMLLYKRDLNMLSQLILFLKYI